MGGVDELFSWQVKTYPLEGTEVHRRLQKILQAPPVMGGGRKFPQPRRSPLP